LTPSITQYAAGLGDVRQPGVVRVERQRDERLEAARAVLQLAQTDQVIDTVMGLLDVTVEHGGVGAQTQLVGFLMNSKPLAGVGLVLADLIAHFGVEDLGAASG
jgi:hypothetical protein